MRAVVVESEGYVVVRDDIPMPVIGPYDALVRIHACGFCNGTDGRIIEGKMSGGHGMQPYPLVLGHEAAGIIEAVGDRVRHLRVGEKHIGIHGASTEGSRYASMHGQMAEYGVLHDWEAMRQDGLALPEHAALIPTRLPDDFDLTDAGALLPLCECLSAVRNFGIGPGSDVLIYGAGPMGLAMMTYMRIVGVQSLICIDSVPERLQMAKEYASVDQAINFKTQDVEKELGGRLFDRVVDAVGLSSMVLEASRRLKPYGVVCGLGVLRSDDALVDLTKLTNNTLIHMLNYPYRSYETLPENLEYIRQGRIDVKKFYSHVMPIEQVAEAARMIREKQALKIVLTL